jgi:hypothetical protein
VLGLILLKLAYSRFTEDELAHTSTGRQETAKVNYQAQGYSLHPRW